MHMRHRLARRLAVLDRDVEGRGVVETGERWRQPPHRLKEVDRLHRGEVIEPARWRSARCLLPLLRVMVMAVVLERADEQVAWQERFEVDQRKAVRGRVENLNGVSY